MQHHWVECSITNYVTHNGLINIHELKKNSHRNLPAVHHQQEPLQPALSLLQEVVDREGALLPHLSLNEVEGVALSLRHHPEVIVLSHTAVRAVVKRHATLGLHLHHGTLTDQTAPRVSY